MNAKLIAVLLAAIILCGLLVLVTARLKNPTLVSLLRSCEDGLIECRVEIIPGGRIELEACDETPAGLHNSKTLSANQASDLLNRLVFVLRSHIQRVESGTRASAVFDYRIVFISEASKCTLEFLTDPSGLGLIDYESSNRAMVGTVLIDSDGAREIESMISRVIRR